MPRKVILDVDTGIDDALALMLAVRSPELEVLGVTCVAGNVTVDQVTRNTLAVLDVLGSRLPVAVGARKPLMAPLRTATYVHGKNGLANIQLPRPARPPVEEDAASFMTRITRAQPGQVTIVAVGPLTNLALALLRDPEFVGSVGGLVIMGGAVSHPGDVTAAAEANFANDPEAAAAVVRSGMSIQLVDLGATDQAVLPDARLPSGDSGPITPTAELALRLLQFYGGIGVEAGATGAILHDPLAVALAAVPELATFVPMYLEVETAGTYTRGESVGTFSPTTVQVEQVGWHQDAVGRVPRSFNAEIARAIDASRFLELFLDRLELGETTP